MKTLLDPPTRKELVQRIEALGDQNKAQWGKMSLYQMVKHCGDWEEMVLGRIPCKRSFIGRIFGQMALKNFLKDDAPMGRNSPTSPELTTQETSGDVAAGKAKWIALLEEHANSASATFLHPFFGLMTREQVGQLAYKHVDHHLRQFGG